MIPNSIQQVTFIHFPRLSVLSPWLSLPSPHRDHGTGALCAAAGAAGATGAAGAAGAEGARRKDLGRNPAGGRWAIRD